MVDVLKNLHIVSDDYDIEKLYDIRIENGYICEIGENIDISNSYVVECNGLFAISGLIDMNCCIGDPGFEHIEDIETASMSASKGGFTTLTCQPSTNPAIDNKAVVDYVISKSGVYSLVNILPYGSMTMGCLGKEISEIGEMYKMGIVALSDGGNSIKDTGLLRNIFKYSKIFDLPVITRCDDTNISGGGVMNEGYMSTLLGLKGIPKEAEEIVVARDIVLAERTGARLHISAVSTEGSVQLIREAKKRGVNVTCETSPQYFTFTEESVKGYNTLFKVKPPLRTDKDRKAIVEGIKDGTIDVISSLHTPATADGKDEVFDSAEWGISNLETAFPVSYTYLVETGEITLESLVEKMSINPAKILKLEKNCINVGAKANMTIVDIENSFTVDSEKFYSKAKFSPYDGMSLKGDVKYTVVNGKIIC